MCDVCEGSGEYPIINKFGKTVGFIECPECGGVDEELAPQPASKLAER